MIAMIKRTTKICKYWDDKPLRSETSPNLKQTLDTHEIGSHFYENVRQSKRLNNPIVYHVNTIYNPNINLMKQFFIPLNFIIYTDTHVETCHAIEWYTLDIELTYSNINRHFMAISKRMLSIWLFGCCLLL